MNEKHWLTNCGFEYLSSDGVAQTEDHNACQNALQHFTTVKTEDADMTVCLV